MLYDPWLSLFFLTLIDAKLLTRPVKNMVQELNDGTLMPMIGLGTWRAKPHETEAAVYYALCKAGYRHIDAAQIYNNQREVGAGIKRAIEECGLKRERIWVTSKIWHTDFHPNDVPVAVDRILEELGLEYVDQILLHWPTPTKKPPAGCPSDCPVEFAGTDDPDRPRDAYGHLVPSQIPLRLTWMALEKLKPSGKVKSIGVSNFEAEDITGILMDESGNQRHGAIVPAVNQVECHVFWNQLYLFAEHRLRGIQLVAYSPLGNPERFPEGQNSTMGLHSDSMQEIAQQAHITPAQVMLNFLATQGIVIVPKSIKPERISENINFGVGLTNHIIHKLEKAPQVRLNNPKNRPGGKPVFDDSWQQAWKDANTVVHKEPTQEDIEYHTALLKMKHRQKREQEIGGILSKYQAKTGESLGDTSAMIEEILDNEESGRDVAGTTKISTSGQHDPRWDL